ncbi:hypothetical protein SAMN05660297_00775 [Natronincola peptidivorans]|uniref:Uncharacterized protein n=1 Tax=Natronincola peptidivorans TaxID=426128 RepID=A0A1H9ZZ37_9FIRM|nr:hypothetical protein [Natronincola peptidivorans]SES86643.1 hypothetical protein SAMN05660297_00775 [Natronincola peptidivorans]
MARRHRNTSRKRSLSQRLGSENVLSNGMLYPIAPTDLAIFEMRKRSPNETDKINR